MFEFKLSNSFFGPVSVKAKLMTTSIEDTESIISSAASTVEFRYKYKPCIPHHSAVIAVKSSPMSSPKSSPYSSPKSTFYTYPHLKLLCVT